jgi:hypothetical protein
MPHGSLPDPADAEIVQSLMSAGRLSALDFLDQTAGSPCGVGSPVRRVVASEK